MTSILPATSGVYRITCTANGKFYIGSALSLNKRRREHLHGLRRNKHSNRIMQNAFNKHGETAFVFDVLEIVLVPEMLTAREQYWIDTLKPTFNLAPIAGSQLGMRHSDATKEKIGLIRTGTTQSEETRQKHSEAGKLRKQSDATKEKVRLIRLGTKRSKETCERLSITHLGKTQSEETRAKHRLAMTGRPVSEETRAQIRASNANHPSHVKRMRELIVTSPDGETFHITGVGRFCKEHGLNHSALIQVAKGVHPHHKHWTARYP